MSFETLLFLVFGLTALIAFAACLLFGVLVYATKQMDKYPLEEKDSLK